MSTAMAARGAAGNAGEMSIRLEFTKNLHHVTNKIHATGNVDEIMLDVSKDICALFNADRLTIYVVGEDNVSLVSKVKTGLNSFKDLKLPIAEQSIAGFAAMNKKAGVPFAASIEEGARELAQTMAVALRQRLQNTTAKTKYDYLVADAVLSAAEFELATRTARRKGIDIEDVLVKEFQVGPR